MDPFLISLGLQGASAVGSWWLREEQANLAKRETHEAVRRFEAQAAQELGGAKAAGAASGIEADSGSLVNLIDTMDAEYKRQADWMRKAGMRQANAMSLGAKLGLISDFGGALMSTGRNAGLGKG